MHAFVYTRHVALITACYGINYRNMQKTNWEAVLSCPLARIAGYEGGLVQEPGRCRCAFHSRDEHVRGEPGARRECSGRLDGHAVFARWQTLGLGACLDETSCPLRAVSAPAVIGSAASLPVAASHSMHELAGALGIAIAIAIPIRNSNSNSLLRINWYSCLSPHSTVVP